MRVNFNLDFLNLYRIIIIHFILDIYKEEGMNNFFVLVIAIISNFTLLFFLGRTNAYKFLKSKIPSSIIKEMYLGDIEESDVSTTIINVVFFWGLVICGYIWGYKNYLYILPFIMWGLAKIWKKSLAKSKIRLYIIKQLVKQNSPETFQSDFVLKYTELMKLVDNNYIFNASDYPLQIEIITAFKESKAEQR